MFKQPNEIFNSGIFNVPPPWWTIRMEKDFCRVGIEPRRIAGFTKRGERIAEPCSPIKATHWVVYGIYRPEVTANGKEYFREFPTIGAAQEFHDRLLADYPHLETDLQNPVPISEVGFLAKSIKERFAWIRA